MENLHQFNYCNFACSFSLTLSYHIGGDFDTERKRSNCSCFMITAWIISVKIQISVLLRSLAGILFFGDEAEGRTKS